MHLQHVAESPDPRVIQARKVRPVRRAPKVFKAFLVLRDQPAHKGLRGRKGQKVTREIRESPAL